MTDLIKRDDALAAITLGATVITLQSRIRTLPAVPTHRYAGESEASVYDRKGFPPIGLQGHAHAPVADSHPAIDPAAIREAVLQARIEELVKENYQLTISLEMCHVGWDQALDEREAAEAKLTKAVAFIRRHIPDSVYEQRQRANAFLAELDGK
jgi:hypothetical protein